MDKLYKKFLSFLIILMSLFLLSSEVSSLSNTPLKDKGIEGMEIISFDIENSLINKTSIFPDRNESISNNDVDFNKINILENTKKSRIKHLIDLNDLRFLSGNSNLSVLIKINSNFIRWNGTTYELSSKPLKLTSWYHTNIDKLIVPNIFFDEAHNKRINYRDIALNGGYALAYKKGENSIIELKIDNLKLDLIEDSLIDPIYINSTDGFYIGGVGANEPQGLTLDLNNNHTIWVPDSGDDFVYWFNLTDGENLSGGFDISNGGSDLPTGIAFEPGPFPFSLWITDNNDKFVYKFWSGTNQSGGFKTSNAGASSIQGIAVGEKEGLWIVDNIDDFVYNFSSDGINQSGGFYLSEDKDRWPTGAAWDLRDNSLWVLDLQNDFVDHFNANGSLLNDGFDISSIGVSNPLGITFDIRDYSFWILDSEDDFIYHIVPKNLTSNVNLQLDGNEIWNHTNPFSSTEITDDFSTHINNYLNNCTADEEGYCNIPLEIHSDTTGQINIDNINVYFNTTEYNWDISNLAELSTYKTRIKSTDGTFNSTEDESDSDFTIKFPHNFYIKNSTGDNVANFNSDGNLTLSGTCFIGNCDNPSSDSFIIKDSGDNIVSYINSTGSLCLESGSCSDLQSNCNNPGDGSFIVRDSSDTNVGFINSTGDLCLTGTLTENANL